MNGVLAGSIITQRIVQMRFQLQTLLLIALLTSTAAGKALAKDPLARDPESVVQNSDVIAVNVTHMLPSVDESHPQYSRLRTIKVNGDLELMAWPIHVLKDGTASFPLLDPIPVVGVSIEKLEKIVVESYIKKNIVRRGEIKASAAIATTK